MLLPPLAGDALKRALPQAWELSPIREMLLTLAAFSTSGHAAAACAGVRRDCSGWLGSLNVISAAAFGQTLSSAMWPMAPDVTVQKGVGSAFC